MNSQTFEVGEVAIYVPGEGFDGHGCEVRILSELHWSNCIDQSTGREGSIYVHLIEGPDLPKPRSGYWAAVPQDLRKKRPPQDWAKLCKLDSVPKGEPMEVA